MINKPTAEQIEALTVLEHHHHFKVIREWLEQSLQTTQERCIEEMNIDSVRQLQGAAKDIKEFLEFAQNARDILETLRR